MSNELVGRLNQLDDFRLLRFFQRFGQDVVNALNIDRDVLLRQVDSRTRSDPALAGAFTISEEKSRKPLSRADALVVARCTLEALARHPGFEDALESSLDDFEDEEMPADILLALGFAASMIILAATTRIRVAFKDGKIEGEIAKDAASPETLREVMGPLGTASAKIASPTRIRNTDRMSTKASGGSRPIGLSPVNSRRRCDNIRILRLAGARMRIAHLPAEW